MARSYHAMRPDAASGGCRKARAVKSYKIVQWRATALPIMLRRSFPVIITHQSPAESSDGISPGDFDAGSDELPQSFFDFGHEFWIATVHRNGVPSHFRKIVFRERQTRNPARIDLKRRFLPQFHRPCLANEEVLAGTPRTLVVRPGRGVEDDRKAGVALAARRCAQHNVGDGPGPPDSRKGKLQRTWSPRRSIQSRRS